MRVRLTGCDLLTLELHATLAARLDDEAAAAADEEGEDEADTAAPLSLAIDLADAESGADSATHITSTTPANSKN